MESSENIPQNNESENGKKGSMWSKITLEPMWLGVGISMSMGMFAFKNLFLQRACLVDLGYTEEMCFRSEGEEKMRIEREAQKIVSYLTANITSVGGLITCIILIFLGPWSDSSGRRKPLIVLPIVGMMLTSLCLLTMQAFPNVSTVYVICAEILPLAIGGNFHLLTMAAFSHLGDVCYKSGRCATVVMGSNTGFLLLFTIIGAIAGPFLYRSTGFVGLFGVSFILELTSLFYAIFKMKDVFISESIPTIFDLKLPLEAVKCIIKKRSGNKRKIVLLMVSIPCYISMSFVPEMSMNYLYLRNKFSWTEIEYGLYLAVSSTIKTIGTLIIVVVLKRKMKMKDHHIGVLGGFSHLVALIMFMSSWTTWIVFGSSLFDIFSRGAMIVERPILNKQITAKEQGKINSVTTILERVISFIFMPLTNKIYNSTLNNFPNAYIFIGVSAALFQIITYYFVNEEPYDEENEIKTITKQGNNLT